MDSCMYCDMAFPDSTYLDDRGVCGAKPCRDKYIEEWGSTKKMKKSIDEVIDEINAVLGESVETPTEAVINEMSAVVTDQLPPDVAELEAQFYVGLMDGFENLHGSPASPEVTEAIQYLARCEAVRRHAYRKLALASLDEFIENNDASG